jgi:hypothetical protein
MKVGMARRIGTRSRTVRDGNCCNGISVSDTSSAQDATLPSIPSPKTRCRSHRDVPDPLLRRGQGPSFGREILRSGDDGVRRLASVVAGPPPGPIILFRGASRSPLGPGASSDVAWSVTFGRWQEDPLRQGVGTFAGRACQRFAWPGQLRLVRYCYYRGGANGWQQ